MQIDMTNISKVMLLLWGVSTCLCSVAFAVYSLCVIYKMIKEVNIACEGDGEKTTGLGFLFLLDYATCGVYSYIWWYKFGNRLAKNALRYGMEFKKLGRTLLALKISKGLLILLSIAALIICLPSSSEDFGFLTTYQSSFLVLAAIVAYPVVEAIFHFVLMGIAFKYANKICAGYNAAHNL